MIHPHSSERDRSYAARRNIEPGSRVRLARDIYRGCPLREGAEGVVRSYSNAGFQGILAWVTLDDGQEAYNLPAGILERA